MNDVAAAANQYLSGNHVKDWEKACLEEQILE